MGSRLIAITIIAFAGCGVWAACGEEQELARSIRLDQCIEQALANSLDLRIERISPEIEKWSIVRERAIFEPIFSSQLNYLHQDQALDPSTADSLGLQAPGQGFLKQQELSFNPSLAGLLPTGTAYGFSANDTRFAGEFVTNNFLFTGGTVMTLSQPLLKNFGPDVTGAGLRVAKKNHEIAVLGLRGKVIDVVSQVSIAYYELLFAVEEHKAALGDLHSAEQLLGENKRLVETGMLSPIEVTQSQAGVAERQEAVIVSEQHIKERQNALFLLMSEEGAAESDKVLVPVDQAPAEPVDVNREECVRTALAQRTDYLQAKAIVERSGVMLKYNRQQLWPQIDLKASYGWNGRNTSFGGLVDSVVSTDHPEWSAGVVVSVPIGNGRARADYESSKLDKERALLNLKRLEQGIVVDVVNAVTLVRSDYKRVEATQAARRLAEESLRAEQQKLRQGLSTSFLTLQAQAQLTAAKTAEIRARVSYDISLIGLDRSQGLTLRKLGIVVEE